MSPLQGAATERDITHTFRCLCDTLKLLLDSLKKKVKSLSCCVNEHKLTAGVCVCYLAPQRLLSDYCISLFFLPSSSSFLLHLSSRNTDDPEVSLQLQCQLHRPPHLCVHALTTEDGAGTSEPPAGQPRGHRNQHGYVHGH